MGRVFSVMTQTNEHIVFRHKLSDDITSFFWQ
jgi:hypothetical protein